MKTDTERLKFLIENVAYVENTWNRWRVFARCPYSSDEDMNVYGTTYETPEDAIDAAMERFK